MKGSHVILICAALLLVGIQLWLKPYLDKREAVQIFETIMFHWKEGELSKGIEYWENPENSPPVYDLLGYSVESAVYVKDTRSRKTTIIATLYFPENNTTPSGKKWLFEISYTQFGWRVTKFELFNERFTAAASPAQTY